jgi:rhodanese-related sulfurtransferase
MRKGSLRQLFSPFGITQLIMVAAVGGALWLAYPEWRWERVKESIRKRYPAAPRITVKELKEWFDRKEDQKPVVVDIRPRAEYDVSHLPGARHVRPSDTPAALGFSEKDNVPFLIYDSVGDDSSSVAAEWTRRGYARVQALEGGIFEWANRGFPLEGPAGPAQKVAPGASLYAGFLKRGVRAP